MFIKESLPQAVLDEVRTHTNGDRDIRIAVRSDLGLDGTSRELWLLATDKRLVVVDGSGTPSTLHCFEFSRMQEVNCERLVFNGYINAVVDGSHISLVRYSLIHARKFAAAAQQVQALMSGDEPKPHPDAIPGQCPTCGFPLEAGTNCLNCIKRDRVILRLLGYLKPYRWQAAAVLVLGLCSVLLGLLPPYMCKLLMDSVLPGSSKTNLMFVVVGLFGASTLSCALLITQGRVGSWIGVRVTHDVRTAMFEHIEGLSMPYFDKRHSDDVTGRMNYDIQELQGFLSFEIYCVVGQLVQLAGGVCLMLIINWKLGLAALAPLPLIGLVVPRMARRFKQAYNRYWHRRSWLGTVISEAMQGLKTTKAFAQEDLEKERVRRSSIELMLSSNRSDAMWITMLHSFVFVMSLGSFVAWWFGGLQVIDDQLTVGSLMAIIGYIGIVSGPIQMLFGMGDRITRVVTAAERVFEVLDAPSEETDPGSQIPMKDLKGRIRFENVTFGYDLHRPVLRNVDFEIKPGEMVGLVGCSGSGKTTMLDLVCRFYVAQEGCVKIDDVDIKNIGIRDLRSHISIVPHETFLFSGTIGENIAYSQPYAPMEAIIEAAKAANAHEFIISLLDGYETWVGPGGQRLSAGEKQRVSIARAILRNPKILILDEATSAIDAENEKHIQEALQRLKGNRTILVVAHRLSTLRNADRLLVIKNGTVCELGSHDELVAARGHYYGLLNTQSELNRQNVREDAFNGREYCHD